MSCRNVPPHGFAQFSIWNALQIQPMTCEELAKHIYHDATEDEKNAIRVTISHLRKVGYPIRLFNKKYSLEEE